MAEVVVLNRAQRSRDRSNGRVSIGA